jgi:Raf kinase inhibitor-like YbhB/YbcL family protein
MSDIALTPSAFRLSSPAFADNAAIPATYTCKGLNNSPPLAISGTPESTKSLALIMHDPDAPSGDFVHWLLWNIHPDVTEIAENAVPPGSMEGTNSFGKPGYGGPCPPEGTGTHRYIFELYALDSILDIRDNVGREALQEVMQGHTIDQTSLIGLFGG